MLRSTAQLDREIRRKQRNTKWQTAMVIAATLGVGKAFAMDHVDRIEQEEEIERLAFLSSAGAMDDENGRILDTLLGQDERLRDYFAELVMLDEMLRAEFGEGGLHLRNAI